MHNKGKAIINQSIPNEFSSTLIKYKVEHNLNIKYNYNLAEITAMREERIRENKETQKRQQISDCIKNCKQNIAKYNQENQSKINESISSAQRGKEYNENLRKQMKLKAEKKKNKNMKNKENEYNIKNYEEEVIPTFSFKEQQTNEDNNDIDENNIYNDFNNNNLNDNLQIKDLSQNIASQIQNNSNNSSPFISRTLASNFYLKNSNNMKNFENHNDVNNNNNYQIKPMNLINNNNFQNSGINKDMSIQQQINNNVSLIQKFRHTGGTLNNENKMDENLYNNNYIENFNNNVPHQTIYYTRENATKK